MHYVNLLTMIIINYYSNNSENYNTQKVIE